MKRDTFLMVQIFILCCLALLSGCAAPIKRQVAWYPVTNMNETCSSRKTVAANDSGCLEKAGTSCTIWTKNRSVSYPEFGALIRECVK